ncbi:MAG: helix-turn-helix domain-containing protein [Candidatus Aminicenantes bacterium]|nr:MAG: helix-turn-helix domain-containing protein [Candidatus Aminicenantes bacterium]
MQNILGAKLRKSREDLGITQDALAKAVNLSSEFISLLELGKRKPSLETLTTVAGYFKKDVSYFLQEKETAFNLLLKGEGVEIESRKELNKFKKYCEEYTWLEEITSKRIELAPFYSNISAERMAYEERRRLGLGEEPIRDVFSLLDLSGCHVIRQPFSEKSQISGVFIFLDVSESAFISVNCAQSFGKQVFTAAHEYCHYLKDRNTGPIIDNPDVFIDEYITLYHPREIFAQTFASRFLMPPRKVKEIISKDIRSSQLSYRDVLYLKRYFGVDIHSMLRTLENLEFVSSAKFEEFQRFDPKVRENALFGDYQDNGRQQKERGMPIRSDRFKSLALEAYKKKKINLEKLCALLGKKKTNIASMI